MLDIRYVNSDAIFVRASTTSNCIRFRFAETYKHKFRDLESRLNAKIIEEEQRNLEII